ncbi:YbaB/EbfC family nucleoid-associated protein [Krasilnikovia sp. MM14-A1259]|uniref:YbaB/EbfC family nucleoid-associated protein n=1 Tax=Krasilnikovia sp. MM14-A1259 TaxID=3373539 RepID=UPI0037F1F601
MLGRNLEAPADAVRSGSEPDPGPPGAKAAVADRVSALADRLAALTASAAGDDGAIRVTVAGSGAVVGLELDDRVRRLPAADLAEQIMAAVRRAQAALVGQVADAVAQTVGAGTETGKAVLESFARRFGVDAPDGDVLDEIDDAPAMPAPRPFPTFHNRPTLPHQVPGVGFESGRDSRAR